MYANCMSYLLKILFISYLYLLYYINYWISKLGVKHIVYCTCNIYIYIYQQIHFFNKMFAKQKNLQTSIRFQTFVFEDSMENISCVCNYEILFLETFLRSTTSSIFLKTLKKVLYKYLCKDAYVSVTYSKFLIM